MGRLGPDQQVRYVGLDISAPMLELSRHRVAAAHRDRATLVEGSVERMPFNDGHFDLCVCFNGLHGVPDPGAAVAEIGRGVCDPVAV